MGVVAHILKNTLHCFIDGAQGFSQVPWDFLQFSVLLNLLFVTSALLFHSAFLE